MITRRSLFGILAGAVAAPIVVRSGLLMPVKAPVVPESPALLTPAMITREALRVLHQKMNFIGTINAEYAASFAGVERLRIVRPPLPDNWPANYSEVAA